MTILRALLLPCALLSSSATTLAQNTEVAWSVFTTGFGESTDGSTVARVITGQAFVGALEGPNLSVGGGFLSNPEITGQQLSLAVSVQEGWNLLSLPVTRDPSNDSVRQVYPTATYEHGWAYVPGVGYGQEFRLANGLGYWIKSPATVVAYVTGDPRPIDTLHVAEGWNLVGSVSSVVDTGTILADPPSNRISPWFGYFGGLTPVGAITPGYAYWVKAETAGIFILAGQAARPEQSKDAAPRDTNTTRTGRKPDSGSRPPPQK